LDPRYSESAFRIPDRRRQRPAQGDGNDQREWQKKRSGNKSFQTLENLRQLFCGSTVDRLGMRKIE